MSKLKETINADFITAFKAGQKATKNTLGMLKTAIMEFEKGEQQIGKAITDSDVVSIIRTYAKSINKTIDAVKDELHPVVKAGREELDVIGAYLPKQMSTEDMTTELDKIIPTLAGDKNKSIGVIMNHFKKNFEGLYNPKELKEMIDKKFV